jgi:hypothetical protein
VNPYFFGIIIHHDDIAKDFRAFFSCLAIFDWMMLYVGVDNIIAIIKNNAHLATPGQQNSRFVF